MKPLSQSIILHHKLLADFIFAWSKWTVLHYTIYYIPSVLPLLKVNAELNDIKKNYVCLFKVVTWCTFFLIKFLSCMKKILIWGSKRNSWSRHCAFLESMRNVEFICHDGVKWKEVDECNMTSSVVWTLSENEGMFKVQFSENTPIHPFFACFTVIPSPSLHFRSCPVVTPVFPAFLSAHLLTSSLSLISSAIIIFM